MKTMFEQLQEMQQEVDRINKVDTSILSPQQRAAFMAHLEQFSTRQRELMKELSRAIRQFNVLKNKIGIPMEDIDENNF